MIAPRGADGRRASARPCAIVAMLAASLATAHLAAIAGSAPPAPAAKSGPSRTRAGAAELSGVRRAPAIEATRWLNTKPLRAADLEGKPRLVEFWTFGCENCRRTVPAIREIQYLYAKRGLVLVGVHTPEFAGERDSAAVASAAKELGLTFPIALDNDSLVWKAYKNRYWPALYLIDREGIIRATHIGELHVNTRAWNNFVANIEEILAEKKSWKGAASRR